MMRNKERLFYWLLSLVLVTLPFPKYSLNSQCIIAMGVVWLFFNPFSEKKINLKKNVLDFIMISSIFFVSIIGLIYTSNFEQAIPNLKIPFLIFPLIILSIAPFTRKEIGILLDLFSIATILASLFALTKALWLHSNDLGDYFYYLDFAKVLEKHTTYFSLFVCISIINIAYGLSVKRPFMNIFRVAGIIFLGFILYLLSSKISIVCLILVLSTSILYDLWKRKFRNRKTIWIKLFFVMILPAMFLTPNLKNRIFKKKASNLSERILLWDAVIDNYMRDNLFFGAGTGDGRDGLVDRYKEIHYDIAAKEHYNAHNQYLEQLLFYGILGLLALLVLISYTLYVLFAKDQPLFFLIFLCFVIYMFSESILERHSGLVLFALITTLFLSYSKDKALNAKNQNS